MLLVDKDIRELIKSNILANADEKQIGSISYDLRTEYFVQQDGDFLNEFTLSPNESVFVACQEIIHMPKDMVGHIALRNSRIREGLMLDAPVYQPGHETRIFFRITNVTEKALQLNKNAEFASILFERLEGAPEMPYSGAFQKELDFRNLGSYQKAYKAELSEVEEKTQNLHHIERNIYGNVITLMTVFIALFSLINVNIDLAYAETIEVTRLLVFNLTTIGSIAFLVSVVRLITSSSKDKRIFWCLLGIAIILLIAALIIAL